MYKNKTPLTLPNGYPGQFVGITELASVLKVSRGLLYKLINSNLIPSIRLGKRILIPCSYIKDLAESLSEGNHKK